jgi:citronellol/citronellal dehydrogenase
VSIPPASRAELQAQTLAAIAELNRRGLTGIHDAGVSAEGVTDFDKYAVSPGTPLMPDFFVPAEGACTVVGRN